MSSGEKNKENGKKLRVEVGRGAVGVKMKSERQSVVK